MLLHTPHPYDLASPDRNPCHHGDRTYGTLISPKIFLSCFYHPKAKIGLTYSLAGSTSWNMINAFTLVLSTKVFPSLLSFICKSFRWFFQVLVPYQLSEIRSILKFIFWFWLFCTFPNSITFLFQIKSCLSLKNLC